MARLYRVKLDLTAALVRCENILYFEKDDDAAGLCNDVESYLMGQLGGCMVNESAFFNVEAKEIGHLILDPDYYTKPVAVAGHAGSGKTDPQLAACVSLHTGLSGRKRRGRCFMAGIPDSWVEDGRITAGSITIINSAWDNIRAHYNSATTNGKLVVFSRTIYSGLTDIILDSYKPVTGAIVNPVMSTMRSRKP